jgi:excisionase family DNA binding protein
LVLDTSASSCGAYARIVGNQGAVFFRPASCSYAISRLSDKKVAQRTAAAPVFTASTYKPTLSWRYSLGTDVQDQWITVDEMQRMFSLSKNKAYDLLSTSEEIEAVRLGRSVRVNKASLISYAERNPYAKVGS